MAFMNTFTPEGCVAITPSDTTQLNLIGLIVLGTGNVTIVDAKGVTTLFTAVPAGFVIACQIAVVKAIGTTATNMIGYVP
jgi:hypothetical protein